MDAPAVDPGQGEARRLVELALRSHAGLIEPGRLNAAVDRAQKLRLPAGRQRSGWRYVWKECGIEDHIRLLIRPVEAQAVERHGEWDAVVEGAEAGPQHGVCGAIRLRIQAPGDGHAWRPIGPIAEVALRLVTYAETEGQVGANAPIVAEEETG